MSATAGNETCLPPTADRSQIDIAAAVGPQGPANPQGLPVLTVPTEGDFVVRHGLDSISTLCTAGLTPRVISGLLIRLLQNHFSSADLIMDPKLQQYLWTQNSLTSKIRIIPNANFDPKSAGQYPAVIVGRGALESKRFVMNDRTQLASGDAEAQMKGYARYTRFHHVSFTITVISEALGEADDLATEVFDTLTYLSPVMTEKLPFHDFQVVGLGAIGALSDVGTLLAVPIQLTMVYESAWALQPLAPRLKTITITAT